MQSFYKWHINKAVCYRIKNNIKINLLKLLRLETVTSEHQNCPTLRKSWLYFVLLHMQTLTSNCIIYDDGNAIMSTPHAASDPQQSCEFLFSLLNGLVVFVRKKRVGNNWILCTRCRKWVEWCTKGRLSETSSSFVHTYIICWGISWHVAALSSHGQWMCSMMRQS